MDVQAVQVDLKVFKPSDHGSKMGDYGYFALSLRTVLVRILCK